MQGLWNKIFGVKKTAKDKEVHADAITEEDLKPLYAEAEKYRAPFVGLVPRAGRDIDRPEESRLGGRPLWPEGEDYPASAGGRPMVFLAQINFADMPGLEGYPDRGLLQVFVEDDDLFGCKFPSRGAEGFRIVYRTELPQAGSAEFPGHPKPEFSPFQDVAASERGVPLDFQSGSMRPSSQDWRLAPLLEGLWTRDPDNLTDLFHENLYEDRSHPHYLGGHPYYVQYDIRSETAYGDYDRVLLQLGWDDLIMWGDAGEATFLIRREDLEARDFSKCLFNWDCS